MKPRRSKSVTASLENVLGILDSLKVIVPLTDDHRLHCKVADREHIRPAILHQLELRERVLQSLKALPRYDEYLSSKVEYFNRRAKPGMLRVSLPDYLTDKFLLHSLDRLLTDIKSFGKIHPADVDPEQISTVLRSLLIEFLSREQRKLLGEIFGGHESKNTTQK